MVRDSALREIIRSYSFASVAGADLAAPFRAYLVVLLLELKIVKSRSQHLESLFLVLDLGFFVLACNYEAGWDMGKSYGGICGVYALAAVSR